MKDISELEDGPTENRTKHWETKGWQMQKKDIWEMVEKSDAHVARVPEKREDRAKQLDRHTGWEFPKH